MSFLNIPVRANADEILASWFNTIRTEGTTLEGIIDWNYLAKTANFSPATNDFIDGNASSGSITMNLPTAASIAGKRIAVRKTEGSANTVTLDPDGSETINGSATHVLSNEDETVYIISDGTNWVIISEITAVTPAALIDPTLQKFTSGSATYTTPTGPAPIYIQIEVVGGGGGGGGSGTATGGTGGTGGNTTFGSSLIIGSGGVGGTWAGGIGGAGGAATLGSGPIGLAIPGGHGGGVAGNGATTFEAGGVGGSSAYGGGGSSIGSTNSGAGGSGAGNAADGSAGAGGGTGGFVNGIIVSPASTYGYTVGAGGAGGTAGSGGGPSVGSAGAAGIIVVTEFYQ